MGRALDIVRLAIASGALLGALVWILTRSGQGGAAALPARVGSIMTSPAVSASEGTGVVSLCRMMHRLRIHHVPIVNDGRVTGIVGSLDICGAVSQKQLG